MTSDEPQITLIGRTSAWRLHQPSSAMDTASRVKGSALTNKPFLVTWLHHSSYGLLSVYATNDVDIPDAARRRGAWVCLQGTICPRSVVALADDPRSAHAYNDAPLLIALHSVQPVAAAARPLQRPFLSSPKSVRVLPDQNALSVRIALVAGWADAVFWQTAQTQTTVFALWNTVYGVVTQLDGRRYLRYVLSFANIAKEGGEHRV